MPNKLHSLAKFDLKIIHEGPYELITLNENGLFEIWSSLVTGDSPAVLHNCKRFEYVRPINAKELFNFI